jgi:hypothetical protein
MDSKGHTKTHIIFLLNNFSMLRGVDDLCPTKVIVREEYLTAGKSGERKKFPFFPRGS